MQPPPPRPNRSVADYDTEDSLRKALLAVESTKKDDDLNAAAAAAGAKNSGSNIAPVDDATGSSSAVSAANEYLAACAATTTHPIPAEAGETGRGSDGDGDGDGDDHATQQQQQQAASGGGAAAPAAAAAQQQVTDGACNDQNLDWVLTNYDPETTEVQSMKEELRRLQVLKSYAILDADREAAFDRITAIGARVFRVPICLVSLVDLGRQWFMSNRGLGDVRETPRKLAFCAHVILSKRNLPMIVPDATKDFRFKNNPLVTGPPDIRFYAGVPLISPEGYKLGTFCIIDDKVRPEGLSADDVATLTDLADMVIDVMVTRRQKLNSQENPAQLIAHTSHDLMTPLTGVQLSLSLLKEDEEVRRRLDDHQVELLTTAATCSDLMIRICETSMASLRREKAVANGGADRKSVV